MPISKENRALYPPNWKKISQRIRFERAGGKCEECGAPHNWYRTSDERLFAPEDIAARADELELDEVALSRIILTTAHLNHDPTDNRDENLRALCQRCHLRLDVTQHATSRRRNQERRSGQTRLFES